MAYIVNKRGAVHSVPLDWVEGLLAKGMTLASIEQIEDWYKGQGLKPPRAVKGRPEGASGTGDTGAADQ
ncbi:MAG: hypothetical protein KIT45_06700 [Fimbriimonadia bacterium]|nr:hypothetical protein [Fimbriimonadia bacterium]